MQGPRGGGEHLGCVGQVLTGLELALAIDDSGALLALSLGLLGHGADHRFGKLNVLELDSLDVDAPSITVLIDDGEDFFGDFFSFAEQLIQGGLGSDAAHGGLCQLEHGVVDIFNLVDCHGRIRDFVVDHGVDFAGDVVFGNRVLLGNVDGFGADIDFAEGLENRDDELPSWVNDITEFAHGVDDSALIFVDLFERDED